MVTRYPIIPILPANEVAFRRGEVTIESLKDGRSLLIYANHCRQTVDGSGKTLKGDNAKANMFSQILDEQGIPVGPERKVKDCPPQLMNIMSPALRRLPDGSLGLAYSWRESTTCAKRVFMKSVDEGETWSDPATIAEGGYVTGCHDRLLITRSGRIIAPLHVTEDWNKHYLWVIAAYSDDMGESWKRSNAVELPAVYWPDGRNTTESGCLEPGVCELTDGRILMVLRTGLGSVFYSISEDGGTHFPPPQNLEITAPCAPTFVMAVPGTDQVMLIWNDEYRADERLGGGRHRLSACVSGPELSFPRERRICLMEDRDHIIDYPCATVRGEEVWLFFRIHETDQLGGSVSSYMMKFPLRDLIQT